MTAAEIEIQKRTPTRTDALIFRGKTAALQLRRSCVDAFGRNVARHGKSSALAAAPSIAESVTPLWTEGHASERPLVAGKIQNLRVAARRLDGVEVAAGETFSFWKHVGRTSRLKGYVHGRELREGCIIANIGGGLCQLSNALYNAALDADFEIVERHAHTQVIAGSLAERGRDATVFWNYIDLRFRSGAAFRIEVLLDAENLTVRFRGVRPADKKLHAITRSRAAAATTTPNSCATCGEDDCHRVIKPPKAVAAERRAFLVDEHSPEFDRYVAATASGSDLLLVPLDGRAFKKGNYAWSTASFGSVRQSIFVTAKRSYRSRKLAAQGSARQQNLLRMYEELADSYASKLSHDTLNLVVQQNLLPFLWRSGALGGRTFDVLMTALPMGEIQKRLDHAALLHPESPTLGDFRADPSLVRSETDALLSARKLITPHAAIAQLFAERAELLKWETPAAAARSGDTNRKPRVVFPATTVGRKGCYELREALRGVDAELVLLGPVIESRDFWKGSETGAGGADWLRSADLVVLPAFVEHRPRRLLAAAASGVPVIATPECGLGDLAGTTTVPAGDPGALRCAVESVLSQTHK